MRVTIAVLACVCALTLAAPEAHAQVAPDPLVARVALLKQIAETVGAAGEAIGKLTDGVQKLVVAGDKAWSTVSARQTHNRLQALSGSITGLATMQGIQTIPAIEEFVQNPTAAKWNVVVRRCNDTLKNVYQILTTVRSEKSDLVFQPAYNQLDKVLKARETLLTKLVGMPTPHTPQELAEIRNILTAYKVLVIKLESARDELNRYATGSGQ